MNYNAYYHITPTKNIQSIKTQGIKRNEYGEVFLFEGCDWLHSFFKIKKDGTISEQRHYTPIDRLIATSQLGLTEYAVFCVLLDEGDKLEPDNVAEETRSAQWIYHKDIEPYRVFLWKTVKITAKSYLDIWKKDAAEETRGARLI